MPIASFTFGQTPTRRMEIHWSAFGFEKYLLDGKLLLKRWALSLSGERTFFVDGRQLRIVFHMSPKDYYSRVFLDDQLIVPELFPDVAAKLEKVRAHGWRRLVINLVVWMVIGFIGMYGYNSYKSGEANTSECPKPKAMLTASNAKSCS
jgi:hypothetical protein